MYFAIRAQKGLTVSLKWPTQIKVKVIDVVIILQIFSIHSVHWAQASLASPSKPTWELRLLAHKHRYTALSDSSVLKLGILLPCFAGVLRNQDLFTPANLLCMQSKHKYAKTKIKEKPERVHPMLQCTRNYSRSTAQSKLRTDQTSAQVNERSVSSRFLWRLEKSTGYRSRERKGIKKRTQQLIFETTWEYWS